MARPSSESVTTPASAVTAQPRPAWDLLPWDLTDPCLLRWAASAPMAAQGWAVRPPAWVQCLTTKMIGQTQKPINLALITIGN